MSGFGIWDDVEHRILSDDEVDELGLYMSRDGHAVNFDVRYSSNDNYTKHYVNCVSVDSSDRYKLLMKVGCG